MTWLQSLAPSSGWYAVRCIFESNWPPPEAGETQVYEERITIWKASSMDDAIALAEAEADEYAEAIADAQVGTSASPRRTPSPVPRSTAQRFSH